jgi:hypothetical protein
LFYGFIPMATDFRLLSFRTLKVAAMISVAAMVEAAVFSLHNNAHPKVCGYIGLCDRHGCSRRL